MILGKPATCGWVSVPGRWYRRCKMPVIVLPFETFRNFLREVVCKFAQWLASKTLPAYDGGTANSVSHGSDDLLLCPCGDAARKAESKLRFRYRSGLSDLIRGKSVCFRPVLSRWGRLKSTNVVAT